MRKYVILVIVILSLFLFTHAWAQTSLKAQINKNIMTTDEALTYKLTIISTEKQVPVPQLPKFEGFEKLSSRQSSNVSFAKGTITTNIVYTFILAPAHIGKLKIEPSSLKLAKVTYSTSAFEIEVEPGKTKSKIKAEKEPPLPERTQPKTEEPQLTL